MTITGFHDARRFSRGPLELLHRETLNTSTAEMGSGLRWQRIFRTGKVSQSVGNCRHGK